MEQMTNTQNILWMQKYLSILPDWTKSSIIYIEIWQWIALAAALIAGILLRYVIFIAMGALVYLARRKTESKWYQLFLEALRGSIGFVFASLFWFAIITLLGLPKSVHLFIAKLIALAFGISLLTLAYRILGVSLNLLQEKAGRTDSTLDDQFVSLFSKTAKTILVVFGVMILIQNMGVNVFSLLTGLGIGGLAFALAAKDTAANLFGSITIFVDRPFKLGDWIRIGEADGIVEDIGLRTTRIRTFGKELVIIPNAEISTTQIVNISERPARRTYVTLGLTYDTPPEKIEAFVEGLKNILLAAPYTQKDNFHVVFSGYGDFSLNIMLYYFQEVQNWSEELIGRHYINLEILRLAKETGVDFAFPTQTLHMETFPGQEPIRRIHDTDAGKLSSAASRFAPGSETAKPRGLGIFRPPYENLR